MGVFAITVIVAFVSLACCFAGDSSTSSTLSTLLKSYDKVVRPPGKGAVKVTVSIYYEYTKWQRNELHTVLYLRQSWNDPRFKRTSDVTRFKACDVIHHIWIPNTYFITGLHPKTVNDGLVDISANGDILWSQSIDIHIPCALDAKDAYVNDGIANCTMPFESYSLVSSDVVYSWSKKPDASNFPDKLSDIETSESKNKYESGEFSGLVVNLKVQTKARKAVIEFASQNMFEKV